MRNARDCIMCAFFFFFNLLLLSFFFLHFFFLKRKARAYVSCRGKYAERRCSKEAEDVTRCQIELKRIGEQINYRPGVLVSVMLILWE